MANAKAVTKAAEEALSFSQNKLNQLAQACGENNINLLKQYLKGCPIKIATDFTNSTEKMTARQAAIDCEDVVKFAVKIVDVIADEFEQMFIE